LGARKPENSEKKNPLKKKNNPKKKKRDGVGDGTPHWGGPLQGALKKPAPLGPPQGEKKKESEPQGTPYISHRENNDPTRRTPKAPPQFPPS